LEEYGINLTHVPGKHNVLADTFSRLPRMEKPTVGKKDASGIGKESDFTTIEVPCDDEDVFFGKFSELLPTVCRNEDTEVMDCFLILQTLTPLQEMLNPVTVINLQNHQAPNAYLRESRMRLWQHLIE